MMKIRIVEMHPPPNFHAAAPAKIPRRGPSISILLDITVIALKRPCLASSLPEGDCQAPQFHLCLALSEPS